MSRHQFLIASKPGDVRSKRSKEGMVPQIKAGKLRLSSVWSLRGDEDSVETIGAVTG